MKTSSSPPRSTATVVDLDPRFAAQLDTVNYEKLSVMSSALLSQFSFMLEQFKLGINNSSVSGTPGVPGPSVSQTESMFLQYLSAPRSHDSGFRMAERTQYLTDWA